MLKTLIDKPAIRGFIDSLPEHNRFVRWGRVLAKAVLFRKRLIRGERVVFEGVEDAICRSFIDVGAGRGEVLVESIFTAVSPGTEKAYYLDLPDFHQERPFIPGYSGCGRVKTAAGGDGYLKRGQVVAGGLKHSSWNIVSGDLLAVVPDGVSPRAASFVSLGVIARCGLRPAEIKRGETVAVVGQGIIGQLVDQMVRRAGAARVIAVARTRRKEAISRESGVDEFIALSEDRSQLEKSAPDRVIDVSGTLSGFEEALRMVKPGGMVVMLGSMPGFAHESSWGELLVSRRLEVRGANIRNLEAEGFNFQGEAAAFLSDLASARIKVDHLITHELQPQEAPAFYRKMAAAARSAVGVVIEWR